MALFTDSKLVILAYNTIIFAIDIYLLNNTEQKKKKKTCTYTVSQKTAPTISAVT